MRFVQRNNLGVIVGTFSLPQRDGMEWLPDDHPDLVAFMAPALTPDADEVVDRKLNDDKVLSALIDVLADELIKPRGVIVAALKNKLQGRP